eukprot:TRINITY_DN6042_c0_g1_i2.p1 TRINITY_DN6042_c0_g1~~TRINITY_DN6042_c0_g1_i2.p1  ORF type:complete len:243 (+),score=40.33 TRINITY_DN6042_c0_g1_i2:198-926(+)
MGRRKIDIQYLQDDRVRKVTFCKRKGGLFKKADDLAKLCGVEVAVIIVQENEKLCTYASTMNDVDRVITRYQTLSTGLPSAPESQIDKLYQELEVRRRELEETQRLLLQERKKVEAFVGQDVQMLTVRPVDMTQMNASTAPVAISQPWPAPQQAQQQQAQQEQGQQMQGGADQLSLSAPVLMNTAAAMGEQSGELREVPSEDDGQEVDDVWRSQEPTPKRAKLDQPPILVQPQPVRVVTAIQ